MGAGVGVGQGQEGEDSTRVTLRFRTHVLSGNHCLYQASMLRFLFTLFRHGCAMCPFPLFNPLRVEQRALAPSQCSCHSTECVVHGLFAYTYMCAREGGGLTEWSATKRTVGLLPSCLSGEKLSSHVDSNVHIKTVGGTHNIV